MNRRRNQIGLCLACLFAAPTLSVRAADLPLNVLWICADDHAAYVTGAYGNALVRTPRIDRLASAGMRFDRAYCNSPVCTASRQSFLTGRYPRTIGVTQLPTPLPESETTLAEMLGAAGYETAAIGKMHFNSNLAHGFNLRLDLPDYQRWIKERGGQARIEEGIEVQPPWRPFRDPARIWLNSRALPFGARDAEMSGTWLADQAARYLAARAEQPADAKPFFLMVSFYEPHSPFHFPVEYRGRHAASEFHAPSVGSGDDRQIPAIFRDLTDDEKQGIAAAYYTSTEFLDKNIGTVLDALDRAKLADNTLVIYTGDHGYMLGQHGRFEKHCCYDPAIRSPLLIRCPGRIKPGSSTAALVELIDVVPTILDFCRVPVPRVVQGKSLAGLLEGRTERHRDQVFVEYSENEEAAIRTERWKFIYGTGKRERQDGYTTGRPLPGRNIRLFDLDNDPEETHNLAGDAAHAARVADFTQQLAEHLRRTSRQPELVPRTDDVHALLEFCLQPRDVGGEQK